MTSKDRKKPTTGTARRWVQEQLMAETLRSAMAEEEPRQLTVRLNPVVAALFESLADRFGSSKNVAANVLIGAALVEAVSALSPETREVLLKDVEKRLGRKLDLTPPPEPPGVFRAALDDVMRIVEDIKDAFR